MIADIIGLKVKVYYNLHNKSIKNTFKTSQDVMGKNLFLFVITNIRETQGY